MKRILPALLLIAAAGCIERTETITVREGGSARIEVAIKGDPGDVKEGEALPSAESGWEVTDRTEKDDAGKETLTRSATREVAAGAAIPASFAAEGGRAAQLGLAFPTTVTLDRREDGTYYHFRRAYARRAWWPVEFLRQEFFETDDIKAILAKDPKTLAEAERTRLVQALVEYSAQEIGMFVQTAAEALPEPLPQLAFLKARAHAQAVYRDSKLADRVVALLTSDAKADLGPLEQEVRRGVRDATAKSLRESGVPAAAIDVYLDRLQDVRDAHDLTQDLGDEHWTVTVKLPGRIVGDNSDAPGEGDRAAGAVAWRFPGKALCDRDLILLATSFVPKESQAEKR